MFKVMSDGGPSEDRQALIPNSQSTMDPNNPENWTALDTIKVVIAGLIFAGHGLIAIYRVVDVTKDESYWWLSIAIICLMIQGIWTLTTNQNWTMFSPTVFLYLVTVVPCIWIIELDMLDKRQGNERSSNTTSPEASAEVAASEVATPPFATQVLNYSPSSITIFTSKNPIPENTVTIIIEQMSMLVVIIGSGIIPKTDITSDQKAQMLHAFIGKSTDVLGVFDSIKDDTVNMDTTFCYTTLLVWSWSLIQFTLVITPQSQEDIPDPVESMSERVKNYFHSSDVWKILKDVILQDGPFFIFRLVLVTYYRHISYINIFFLCKNTLIIIVQVYRLFVVKQVFM